MPCIINVIILEGLFFLPGRFLDQIQGDEFAPENTFLSFEMRMKCGIGKRGRCNIGPKYVCIDGPVFSLAQVNALPNEY